MNHEIISRRDATRLGLKFYFTGRPCKAGHLSERDVAEAKCLICRRQRALRRYYANHEAYREAQRKYYRKNKVKILTQQKRYSDSLSPEAKDKQTIRIKKWHKVNKKARRAHCRTYRLSHKEQIRLYTRAYREANHEWARATVATRRARRLGADGSYTAADVRAIYDIQNGLCANPQCAVDISIGYSIDHKIPLCRGGSNWPDNIQLLCTPCNSSKSSKTMEEWLA